MFFSSQIKTAYASKAAIAAAVEKAHLVIGAVLVPGAAAPKLVTRDMLKTMKRGSVLVDIAIDQGGCFETSHATTQDRKSVGTGKGVSVRVDLGGRRTIQKKTHTQPNQQQP